VRKFVRRLGEKHFPAMLDIQTFRAQAGGHHWHGAGHGFEQFVAHASRHAQRTKIDVVLEQIILHAGDIGDDLDALAVVQFLDFADRPGADDVRFQLGDILAQPGQNFVIIVEHAVDVAEIKQRSREDAAWAVSGCMGLRYELSGIH